MFTGLVEAIGAVSAVKITPGGTRITVAAPDIAMRLRTGDSVAVSGVCLTALSINHDEFSADLAQETIARTTLSRLGAGGVVNLELPTPAGSPLGGHVVQGHVDGTASLLSLEAVNPAELTTTDWEMRLRLPAGLSRYVVAKGSITVEGISLTVAAIAGDEVVIAVIPHTYASTSLRTLRPGDGLNIEVDVLAKYAEKRIGADSRFEVTEAYLLANGY